MTKSWKRLWLNHLISNMVLRDRDASASKSQVVVLGPRGPLIGPSIFVCPSVCKKFPSPIHFPPFPSLFISSSPDQIFCFSKNFPLYYLRFSPPPQKLFFLIQIFSSFSFAIRFLLLEKNIFLLRSSSSSQRIFSLSWALAKAGRAKDLKRYASLQ